MSKLTVIPKPAIAAVVLAVAIALLCPRAAFAQNSPQHPEERRKFDYCAEIDFNSAFVWRGIALSDRPVIQPWGCVSAYGLTLTAWTNFNPAGTSEGAHLHTTDLTLTYS